MSSQSTYEPSRNSSRRGGRNRGRRGGSSSNRSGNSSGGGYRSSQPRPEKKKTLWQKILAFFGGGEPAKPQTRSEAPARERQRERTEAPVNREAAPRAERKSRKPEQVEVTSSRIYVGNLSFDASESDLFELFAGVGLVQNVEVVSNRQTQRSKGFAFVQMQTVDEAKRAVAELHDKEYMGRKLVVSGAKALDERRSNDRAESAESSQPEVQQQQPEQ